MNQGSTQARPLAQAQPNTVELNYAVETNTEPVVRHSALSTQHSALSTHSRAGPAMAVTRCCVSIQRLAVSVTCSRVSERTMSG
jgi:hypothetical protein